MPKAATRESCETERLTRSKKLTRTPMPRSQAMRQRRRGRRAWGGGFGAEEELCSFNRLLVAIFWVAIFRVAICWRSDGRGESSLHHVIFERANGVDGDANPVAGHQGKVV